MSGNPLTGKKIRLTYGDLIRVDNNGAGVGSALQPLLDGLGNPLPLQLSNTDFALGISINPSRLLTSGVPSKFSTAVRMSADANSTSTWPSAQMQGNKFAVPVGNLVASEQVTINKGEVTLDYPNWNPTTGNFNAFGDLIKLQCGITLTVWARQTGDAATDGNSTILGSISYDDGGSWGLPFAIYTASTNPTLPVAVSGGLGQDHFGRIFASIALLPNGAGNINSFLIWTDDPTGQTGWTSPNLSTPMIDPGYPTYYLTSSPILELSDGQTLIAVGYGPIAPLTTTAFNRQATLIQSTNRGVTWTHRSNVAIPSGPSDTTNVDYIEPCMAYRPDGKLFVTMRQQQLHATVFAVSTDLGASDGNWVVSSVAAGTYVPFWSRTSICTLDDGAMVILGRYFSTPAQESALYICRDGSGMNTTSWQGPLLFDFRHYQNEYGGLIQIRKNVVGCVFAGAQLPARNTSDWTYMSFSDGRGVHPADSLYTRNLECHNIAANWQTVQSVKDPVRKIASPANATDLAVNAIIDLLTTEGLNLQHPADGGTLVGQWDTWRVPSTVNNYVPSFTQADNTSVVPNAARTNGQTITPVQQKGTWGTLSNHLYLSATSGGGGYNPHITYPFASGDGRASLSCLQFSAAFCILLRWIDADNFLMAYVDGTRIRLYKVVADSISGGNLLFDGALSIGSVPVVFDVVASGNNIQMFVNVNGAGYPTTPQVNYTLVGGDQTTYANTLGTWGILEFATSSNRFDSFTFTKGPLVIGTSQSSGDQFGEIPEFASTGVGSLIQTTTNNQGVLYVAPLLGRNTHPYLRINPNAGNKVWYKTGTFSAKLGPFTVFLVFSFSGNTGSSNSLFKITDGASFTGSLSVTGTSFALGGQTGHFFSQSNAITGYPFGAPVIIRCVFNGGASQIWMDGRQIASGDTGSIGSGITAVQLGDDANNCIGNALSIAVFAGGLMTASAIHEQERQYVALLKVQGWNDR